MGGERWNVGMVQKIVSKLTLYSDASEISNHLLMLSTRQNGGVIFKNGFVRFFDISHGEERIAQNEVFASFSKFLGNSVLI